jgi:hypothetical protein
MRQRNTEWPKYFFEVDIEVSPLRLHSDWKEVPGEWKNRLQKQIFNKVKYVAMIHVYLFNVAFWAIKIKIRFANELRAN